MNKNNRFRKLNTEKVCNIRETTTFIDTSEEIKYINPKKDFRIKSKKYNVIIPSKKDVLELDSSNKINLRDFSLRKIFQMAEINKPNFPYYLTLTITLTETEYIKNPKKELLIDYKLFIKLIDSLYINFGEDDSNMRISQSSIQKIFDMLDIPPNDRNKYLEFYLVEENELTEVKTKKAPRKIQFPLRNKNNTKIKNTSGPSNLSYKFLPSSLDNAKNLLDNLNLRPETTKLRSKNLKPKDLSKDDVITKLTEIQKIIKKIKKNPGQEDEDTGTKIPYIESDIPEKNECTFPFLLRKIADYENYPMYLTGSIKKLGEWKAQNGLNMDEELRNDKIFYSKYVDLHKDEFPFEYKYFYLKNNLPVYVGLGNSNKNYICHPQFFNLYNKMQKNHISIFDLNIRYYNFVDGKNLWPSRKDKLVQSILNTYCDILFFQEITRIQYEILENNLASIYEFVGVYRDTTDVSEKCPISYNRFKYTLNDWGQFWLSSTPNEPCSNDFVQFFPRICTWCCLKQINGIDLIFFNTHLDHANFLSHIRAIVVILDEIQKILGMFPQCKTVFLGGCFYEEGDTQVINKVREAGFKEVIHENTFHDFTGEADRHWDYLFYKNIDRNDNIHCELREAYVAKKEGTVDEVNKVYISDHYPLIAQFEIKNSK